MRGNSQLLTALMEQPTKLQPFELRRRPPSAANPTPVEVDLSETAMVDQALASVGYPDRSIVHASTSTLGGTRAELREGEIIRTQLLGALQAAKPVGLLQRLLAPFTRGNRLLHKRLAAIEASIAAIVGDRAAAIENKALSERCAFLEGNAQAAKTAADNALREQTERANMLRSVLLEVQRNRFLPTLVAVASGQQVERVQTITMIESVERLVAQTLSMEAEAFPSSAENKQDKQ